MQDKLIGAALLVVVAVIGLFILVGLLDWVLPDAAPLGDWADIVLAVVTILAILFGGLFAAVKFDLFRDFEPHLTITHSINHRALGNGYWHLDVKATLNNSSKVRVELHGGYFLLQQIRPVSGEENIGERNIVYPFWPVLEEFSFDLGDRPLELEPGQAMQEVLQFMVPGHVETVLIHYSFHDAGNLAEQPSGWGITEVHDIIGRNEE